MSFAIHRYTKLSLDTSETLDQFKVVRQLPTQSLPFKIFRLNACFR